jgi:hypothetical protein
MEEKGGEFLPGSTFSAPQSGTKDVPTRSVGTRFHGTAGIQSRIGRLIPSRCLFGGELGFQAEAAKHGD